MKTFPVVLPDDLPPAVALALFETLDNLSNAIWNLYESDLIELMMAERNQVPPAQQALDFNDELPF
jgi:hypothetical protein